MHGESERESITNKINPYSSFICIMMIHLGHFTTVVENKSIHFNIEINTHIIENKKFFFF